jgi:hypothetical protein
MKKYKNIVYLALAGLLLTVTTVSCNKFKGDVEVPAYLHLDRVDIVPQAQNAPSVEAGFYTHIIDAVQLVCWFEGDGAETNLGVFQLPFTVPVLRHGVAKYLRVVPVVKQNGIAGSRIAYPYYHTIELNDIKLAAELKKQGYPIARRTVAKYREQLGIPTSNLRRGDIRPE